MTYITASSEPLVSVITPTYQHGAYIRECVESVITQTFRGWELIVVDDGSTDDTLDKVRSLADPRISVLERSHVGIDRLADTYNAALAVSRGTYVGVLEGDDRWAPQKLARQIEIMSDPSIVVTYARYAVMGSHGKVLSTPPLAGPRAHGPLDALGPLLCESFIEVLTTLVRRDALAAIGGFRQIPGHHHIDYATFLGLAELGPFFADGEVVGHWRRHAASATAQAVTAPRNFEGPALCRRLAIEVRRRHPERRDLPTEGAIEASWSTVLARRYWHSGRVLQAQGRWGEARRLFVTGLRARSSLRQRAMLSFGIIAATLHMDLERIAGIRRGGSPLSDL